MPTEDILYQLVQLSYHDGDLIEFSLKSISANSLDMINSFIEPLAKVFLYVGVVFALFASLMLMNFIMVSISYKKREIGILRAIGARTSDVFKIFFNESAVVAFINFVLSTVACILVVGLLNSTIRIEYGFAWTLLNVSFRQIALIFGVSFVSAFISSFLPVYRFSRKKPIDVINDR